MHSESEHLIHIQNCSCSSRSLHEVHSSWHAQSWTEVDSSDLLTRTEDQLDLLSELPQAVVQGWDLYQHTHRLVTVAQSTVPVLERLKRWGAVEPLFSIKDRVSVPKFMSIVQNFQKRTTFKWTTCITCFQVHCS